MEALLYSGEARAVEPPGEEARAAGLAAEPASRGAGCEESTAGGAPSTPAPYVGIYNLFYFLREGSDNGSLRILQKSPEFVTSLMYVYLDSLVLPRKPDTGSR